MIQQNPNPVLVAFCGKMLTCGQWKTNQTRMTEETVPPHRAGGSSIHWPCKLSNRTLT